VERNLAASLGVAQAAPSRERKRTVESEINRLPVSDALMKEAHQGDPAFEDACEVRFAIGRSHSGDEPEGTSISNYARKLVNKI